MACVVIVLFALLYFKESHKTTIDEQPTNANIEKLMLIIKIYNFCDLYNYCTFVGTLDEI